MDAPTKRIPITVSAVTLILNSLFSSHTVHQTVTSLSVEINQNHIYYNLVPTTTTRSKHLSQKTHYLQMELCVTCGINFDRVKKIAQPLRVSNCNLPSAPVVANIYHNKHVDYAPDTKLSNYFQPSCLYPCTILRPNKTQPITTI